LVGNVVAGAVILPDDFDLPELTDSKKLSEKKREILYTLITDQCQWA
jgi:ribonuclease HII